MERTKTPEARKQWLRKVHKLSERPKTWADVLSRLEVLGAAINVLKSAIEDADAVFGHENEPLMKEEQ
jgi:hypothetical protein